MDGASLYPPLPFGWIPRCVKNPDHYDSLVLDRKVNRVWESPSYCSPDAGTEFLVLERTVKDTPVSMP